MTNVCVKFWFCASILSIVGAYICKYEKNEVYSFCGNLCEDRCSDNLNCNVLEISFSLLGFDSPACERGCFCRENYIRNEAGECVPNTPTACAVNKCAGIKNAVWKRCSYNKQPGCKSAGTYTPEEMWKTRCVCPEILLMSNLFGQKACLSRADFVCRIQGALGEDTFYLPAPNC